MEIILFIVLEKITFTITPTSIYSGYNGHKAQILVQDDNLETL